MSERIPVAVIGVGHLGSQHARVYAALPAAELVAVVDSDEKRAREIARKHGVPALTDYRELPERVRAVSVAVPTTDHYAVTRDCLAAGRHVLVEKPLTRTVAEGRELVELARAKKLCLQVGHIERFNSLLRAARPKIHRPRFFEARRISPFSFRSSDSSVVLDIMIHDLDLILDFVGAPPSEVAAVGVPVLGRSEDIVNARLVFPGGCVADITASRVSLKKERKIRLFQDDAYFSLDLLAGQGVRYWKGPKLREGRFDPTQYKPSMLGDIAAFVFGGLIEYEKLAGDSREPLAAELESFLEAVRDSRRPVVAGEDGLRALEVAEWILREVEQSRRRFEESQP